MHADILHFTVGPLSVGGPSSEVVKLDLLPSGGFSDQGIGLYDLLDLMRVLGRHNSLPAALDLNSSDFSDIFQLFETLKQLAG